MAYTKGSSDTIRSIKMKNSNIASIIENMVILLKNTSSQEWVNPLEKLRSRLEKNEEDIPREILRLYGGVGSLNDVVIYDGGTVPIGLNQNFNTLRKVLFEKCKSAL